MGATDVSQPQYYRYAYTRGSTGQVTSAPVPGTADWLVEAQGNVDGDKEYSSFVSGGRLVNNQPITITQIIQESPEE